MSDLLLVIGNMEDGKIPQNQTGKMWENLHLSFGDLVPLKLGAICLVS